MYLNIHRKGDVQHEGCACASAHPENTLTGVNTGGIGVEVGS